MPQTFGSVSKSIFLNGPESHKLALQFQAANYAKITFSANLITSNKINMKVNGVAMDEVTFATDHATTMAAIVTALAAVSTVKKVVLSAADSKVIYLIPTTAENPVISDAAVTAGTSAATITAVTTGSTIYPGMPVALVGSDELVVPLEVAAAIFGNVATYRFVGVSIHEASPGELLTAYVRGYTVVYGIASADTTAGPVKTTGYDSTNGYTKYENTSQVYDAVGWALDNVSSGEVIRILIGW